MPSSQLSFAPSSSASASAGARRIQPLPRHRPRVRLSKEARTLLTASRHEKSNRFKAALNDAWHHIDESVKSIASANHKSIRRVQHDLYMGQSLLRSKRLKSSAWNAFCWKKGQTVDKENGTSSLDLILVLLTSLFNKGPLARHSYLSLSTIIVMSTMRSPMMQKTPS
jgi:hypothetical protein